MIHATEVGEGCDNECALAWHEPCIYFIGQYCRGSRASQCNNGAFCFVGGLESFRLACEQLKSPVRNGVSRSLALKKPASVLSVTAGHVQDGQRHDMAPGCG